LRLAGLLGASSLLDPGLLRLLGGRRLRRGVEARDARLDLGALVGGRLLVEERAVVLDRRLGIAELVVAERQVVVVEIGRRELLRRRELADRAAVVAAVVELDTRLIVDARLGA